MSGATSFLSRLAGEVPAPTYRRSWLRLEAERTGIPQTSVANAIRDLIIGKAQEVVIVAAVDPVGQVREVVEVARGDYHAVAVPLPAVLAVPLLAGTGQLVVAHNHPSGRLWPSEHDYRMTKQVAEGANAAGLILQDHLIYGPDGRHVSLRESHVLEVPEPTRLEVQA